MNSTEYVPIELADAQPGDEVKQAGEWCAIESVHVFGHSRDMAKVIWAGGGSMTLPLSHRPAVRRAVVAPEPVLATVATVGSGRSAHFAYYVGDRLTGTYCDRAAWESKRVRPMHSMTADQVTCSRCLRVAAAEDSEPKRNAARAALCHAARTGDGYWTCDVPGRCADCRELAAELVRR